VTAAFCLVFALVAGVGPREPLVVSAAVSLTEALGEIGRAYEAAGGGRVTFNLAGSNVLARQIVNGAPVDVFVSADDAQMDVVEKAGMLASDGRVAVTANQLVVVTGSHVRPIASAHELTDRAIKRIAIGDPAAVPAGVYAKAYLERIGVWGRLEPKLVPTTNVRAALTAVQTGAADAAIVYATDARTAPDLRLALTIAGAESPRIVYPAAIVKTTRRESAARAFLTFLRSPAAQQIFARHGFISEQRRP
jgi:molybdate transport system substrate-binding protein